MKQFDLVIIGGGISGVSAAVGAIEAGITNILIIEREETLGGVLNQCIHVGFGERFVPEMLTGPEFINYFEEIIKKKEIIVYTDTEVLDINNNKIITCINPNNGVHEIKANSIILATGCREKFVGSINIPIHKFTGIFTIGSAHKIVNLEGYLPGKEVVIKGNNAWALFAARRLSIEGAVVKGIIINTEKEVFINEENKGIIDGFNIPIFYGYKIVEISGEERINKVKAINVETGEGLILQCDSLLLGVAYMPQSKLAMDMGVKLGENNIPIIDEYRTNIPGVFACGSMLYGNKIFNKRNVDGFEAGIKAGQYLKEYF
ncbi:MAG: NAD(P)/FAD-dependent oxidoreductase [Clostridium sp.]